MYMTIFCIRFLLKLGTTAKIIEYNEYGQASTSRIEGFEPGPDPGANGRSRSRLQNKEQPPDKGIKKIKFRNLCVITKFLSFHNALQLQSFAKIVNRERLSKIC